MTRLIIAGATGVLVAVVATWLQRRRPAAPTQSAWRPPMQIDRNDFVGADKEWLIVVFTSALCDACEKATTAGAFLEGPDVAYQVVTVEDNVDLHGRYRVEQVPLLLMADRDGVVKGQFVGPPVATEVWSEFALVREKLPDE